MSFKWEIIEILDFIIYKLLNIICQNNKDKIMWHKVNKPNSIITWFRLLGKNHIMGRIQTSIVTII